MVRRYVVHDRGILTSSPVKALVASDSGSAVVDFNQVSGISDIDPFLDVFIGDGVISVIYDDVVIQLNRGGFPLAELVGEMEPLLP